MSDQAENKSNFVPTDPELFEVNLEDELALDDARRVKVLSPGMLVFKRFIRNKLAVAGLIIIVFMFLFSFVGPLFSPFGQAQVFTGEAIIPKEYAAAIYNQELRYTIVEGEEFTLSDRAQFFLALGKENNSFTSGDSIYYFTQEGENAYRIMQLDPIAEVMIGIVTPLNDAKFPKAVNTAYEAAKAAKESSFVVDGTIYHITKKDKGELISTEHDVVLAILDTFDAYRSEYRPIVDSFDFKLACIRAINQGNDKFIVDRNTYSIDSENGQYTIYDAAGNEFAAISNIIVNPINQSEFLSVDFKSTARQAIDERQSNFTFPDADGNLITYEIGRVLNTFNIRRDTQAQLIRMFENPSVEHPLGLDNNGMDVMTRLMYGGQVSLMVGFIVVFIEIILGVIIGGISGYFGGAIDTILMRVVDLFNSIPFYPIVIIIGSVMDTLEIEPRTRIFILMVVLGILGWTGVARVVRGQILSLREQDFMVAAEATGIPTSRRIFRHLVPNVMPLLIVQATGSLGGIIITEATLGFLGLGVKYPEASWGSIINVASDAFVMTNYWFMWIPAGLLILLTVLGFNFIGDGLRDAFDPKMKR
jgi:peptide/nickel transport system permease protein